MKFMNLNPFLRMASYIEYLPHNKQGFPRDCRIIFITKGTASVEVDGQKYTMSENSLFFCRAGMPYKLIGNEKLKLYVFNFDLTDENSHNEQTMPVIFDGNVEEVKYDIVEDISFLNSHLFIENAEIFKNDITFINEEMSGYKPFSREMSGSALKQLIIKIYRRTNMAPFVGEQLKEVAAYIHDHFTEKITNEQLAKIAGYHEYHLNRIFKVNFGKSVHQYIIDLRFEKAKQLLSSGTFPLVYVSEVCGFDNYTYFSSCFTKRYGCSPLNYRKEYGQLL